MLKNTFCFGHRERLNISIHSVGKRMVDSVGSLDRIQVLVWIGYEGVGGDYI